MDWPPFRLVVLRVALTLRRTRLATVGANSRSLPEISRCGQIWGQIERLCEAGGVG